MYLRCCIVFCPSMNAGMLDSKQTATISYRIVVKTQQHRLCASECVVSHRSGSGSPEAHFPRGKGKPTVTPIAKAGSKRSDDVSVFVRETVRVVAVAGRGVGVGVVLQAVLVGGLPPRRTVVLVPAGCPAVSLAVASGNTPAAQIAAAALAEAVAETQQEQCPGGEASPGQCRILRPLQIVDGNVDVVLGGPVGQGPLRPRCLVVIFDVLGFFVGRGLRLGVVVVDPFVVVFVVVFGFVFGFFCAFTVVIEILVCFFLLFLDFRFDLFLVKGFLEVLLGFLFLLFLLNSFFRLGGEGLVSHHIRVSLRGQQFGIVARALDPSDAVVEGIKQNVVPHDGVGSQDAAVRFRRVDPVLVLPIREAFHVVRRWDRHDDIEGMVRIEVSRQPVDLVGSPVGIGHGLVEDLVPGQLNQDRREGGQLFLGQVDLVVLEPDSVGEGLEAFSERGPHDLAKIGIGRPAVDNDAPVLVDVRGVLELEDDRVVVLCVGRFAPTAGPQIDLANVHVKVSALVIPGEVAGGSDGGGKDHGVLVQAGIGSAERQGPGEGSLAGGMGLPREAEGELLGGGLFGPVHLVPKGGFAIAHAEDSVGQLGLEESRDLGLAAKSERESVGGSVAGIHVVGGAARFL
mmetsp:Transcript_3990/g.11355  ORF Transcript_3990/g.11355 Transcript_3990/m.11355 type:complete len:626 (-) Transcript_3990:3321-5198(-)